MIEVPEPLLDIARTTARLPRRPRADADRSCSSNVASTFAAAGCVDTAFGLSKICASATAAAANPGYGNKSRPCGQKRCGTTE